MKKLLAPLLALGLLLSSCSHGQAPSTPLPSSTPTPVPVASPSSAPLWWERPDLSLLPQSLEESALLGGVPCWLMGTAEDVQLYCGVDVNEGGWLLRRGDAVQYFPAPMARRPETAPKLQWGDFDADGQEELLILYYTTPQSADLHIYEWAEGWTDRHFGPEVYNPLLLDAIEYHYEPRTATVACGGNTVSYTLGPEEAGRVGLWDSFGDLLFYRVEDTSLTAVFGIGLNINGQARYFANVTAQLCYDGASFSLLNFQLLETGGV
ncbi:hypothetical protein [Lawsonibacter celer]|jgi:hypothetical protein|uniref:hypothetical protein n=1 Tax=Lawsonibacter celer TaxID=2986526 RepID=UPI001646003F|nr:hypothetical protein [Lawsonibacter celer]